MVNRKNYLLVTIWLFLILAVGFGAFMGSGLSGSNINFPPAGTAYAETTEALAKTQWLKLLRLRDATVNAAQWTYQNMTSMRVAFPEISIPYQTWGVNLRALPKSIMASPALKLIVQMVGGTIVLVVVVITFGNLVASAASSTVKEPRYRTSRQRAYVNNVIEIR